MKSQAKGGSRVRRLGIAAGAAVVLLGVAACAARVEDKPKDDEVTAKELAAHGHGHFRGPVKVVIDSARAHCNLTAAQEQTLRAIADDLEQDHAGRRELGEKLRGSAVAVVRSGTADSVEFDRAVDQAVRTIEERMDRSADALEEIHLTLDAEQRATLATALRAQIEQKLGPRRQDETRQREGFDRLASHLMLSAFQVDKLKAMKKELLGEREKLSPSREELLALVSAFEGDDFRAALDAFKQKKSGVLRARVSEAGERTDAVLTLLTPSQRDLLADLIERGPQKVLLGERAGQPSE